MYCQNDGRSSRICSQPIYCLEDADRVRKELEQERRRMRLQQVREESKNVARKIRNNVAFEKDRQLRELELAKAQEMECWRQSVMAQQHQDYRSAIFQVGNAHAAAQIEKQRMALKECQKSNQGSTFRKQLRARRSCEIPSQQLNQQPLLSSDRQRVTERNKSRSPSAKRQGAPSQGPGRSVSAGPSTAAQNCAPGSAKRKRHVEFHAKGACNCTCQCAHMKPDCQMPMPSDSDEDEDSGSSCMDSTLMDTDTSCAEVAPCHGRGGLSKTPTVIVDVEVCSDDSVSISIPAEIKDKHVSSNRQFSRVVRASPEPKAKVKAKTSSKLQPPAPPRQQSKPKTPQKKRHNACAPGSAPTAVPKTKSSATPKKKPATAGAQTTATTAKKPLVTASPKKNENKRPPSPSKKAHLPAPPPTSPRTSSPSPERPLKSQTATAEVQANAGPVAMTSLKANTTASTVVPNTTKTSANTRVTNVSASLDSGGSSGSILCAGRVQFFDYKNKFTKEYPQPASAVRFESREPDEPNAMEQASIETGRQQLREKEIEALRKKSDERGLKALERETVRRDCSELTERLESLSKPNLPSLFLGPDPTILPAHHFTDLAARRERQMNAAMEDIVLKPAIITCPVIGESQRTENSAMRLPKPQQQQQKLSKCMSAPNTLNLGTNDMHCNDTVSSESCRSILLGYVNDQSQQLRHDLSECHGENQHDKTDKLKELLNRIEELRDSLIQELNKQEQSKAMPNVQKSGRAPQTTARLQTAVAPTDNVQQLMASINDVRRQRDSLLQEQRKKESEANQAKMRSQKAECRSNSAKLKEEMRKICELLQSAGNEDERPKQTRATSPKRCAESGRDKPQKPMEIVIKVQEAAEKPRKRSSTESKPKLPKTPRRLVTVATLPPKTVGSSKKSRNKQRASLLKAHRREMAKHNSYDSNSTSYRSLPPTLSNKLDAYVTATQPEHSESESEPEEQPREAVRVRPQDNLNPLMAQYVNRLLAMSSRSIQALGVSSSEMDTPDSSVVNTPSNRQPENPGKSLPALDASWITDDRLQRVQRFIQDNRSFIHDLESTMLTNNTNIDQRMSLEMSMQAIEEVWRQRCGENNSAKQPQAIRPQQPPESTDATKRSETKVTKEPKQKKTPLGPSNTDSNNQRAEAKKKKEPSKQPSKPKLTAQPAPAKSAVSMAPPPSRTRIPQEAKGAVQKKAPAPASRSVETQVRVPTPEEDALTEAQVERYGEMTKNCTQRIKQLNGLISKVREEKQKLLEVTLSSVSSHERNSTGYADLPHTTKSTADSSTSAAVDTNSGPSTSKQTQSKSPDSGARPLDKLKAIGGSRDSGISVSRPMTATGEHQPQADGEPVSVTSSAGPPLATSGSQHAISHANKPRPPATLRRFSPQLVDDELAHELSTILEVDTPVTSRLNTSIQQPDGGSVHSSTKVGQPIAFPTFEQYAQQTNLNLTQMDPDMSRMIEQEYNDLVTALRNGELYKELSYKEFPSLNTYLKDGTSPNSLEVQTSLLDVSPDNVEDLLECLRLANVTLRSFPNHRDYMKQVGGGAAEAEENDLIDTASLENVTSSSTTNSTTQNIEEELKLNKVKKQCRTEGRMVTASTSRTLTDGDTKIYAKVVTAESGVEKMSDTMSGDLEKDLRGIGLAWTVTMRKKGKEAAALSGSSSTTPTSSSLEHLPVVPEKNHRSRQYQLDRDALQRELDGACESHSTLIDEGRPLNLHEFFTKKLEKCLNTSSSSSGTDESWRSQFLHSIMDSMSPRHTANPSQQATSANNRTERQKTSTPVPSNSAESRSRGGAGLGSGPLLLSSSTSLTTNSSSNLFSGESRLSSVHYQDLPSMHCLSTDTKNTTKSGKPQRK